MRQLPELFDVGVKARSLAYLFVAGATLGLLTLLLPHDEGVQDLQLYILAAVAIAVAALIYVQAERVSEWQLHLVLAAGTTILSFANYYTGTSTLYPLLYTWTALFAFYFFPLSRAFAHMVFIGFAYAVVLAIQDPNTPAIRWLLAVGTPLIAGLLISRMLDRLRAQQVEASESARSRRRASSSSVPSEFWPLALSAERVRASGIGARSLDAEVRAVFERGPVGDGA